VAATTDTAMILAAGRGTRLQPVTDRVPKCMVWLHGKPLLEHTVLGLRAQGITQIVINLHHLGDAIANHFDNGSRFGVNIRYSRESELLGTAGGVKRALDDGLLPDRFLVWYGDNLSLCRIENLATHHHLSKADATIAVHHRDDPTKSGIVEIDERGRITRFLEKPTPDQIFSRWVNAGIYLVESRLFTDVPSGFCDFGRDVFPRMLSLGKTLAGYRMDASEDLLWIDSPEDLRRTEERLPLLGKQKDSAP
jgi:mannose-1-phosphate guanylyltransferase